MMRILLLTAAMGALGPLAARAATVELVAGGAEQQEPIAATNARLHGPFGVDFTDQGTMYIVEMVGQRILAVDPRGSLTTLAGNGEKGDSGDGGPARQATFNGMHHVAVGPDGNLYIADTWNNRIRKIDARTGQISAFAGTGRKGFNGDGGPASAAEFGGVYCLAFAPGGQWLYVDDLDNRRIRRIDLKSGVVDTVAGNGERGVPADGSDARQAPLVDPRAVAADARGNVYILERAGNALRVVDSAGKIRTVAGQGAKECRDEQGNVPQPMKGPKHLCVDGDGDVLIADTENHVIRKFLPAENKLIRVAGTGEAGSGGVGGAPLTVQLKQPHGVLVRPSGEIFISDSSNDRVLKIVP